MRPHFCPNRSLSLFLSFNVPVYFPFSWINYYHYCISISNFRSSFPWCSLLVYISCKFIVSNEVLAVLSSINTFDFLSSDSVHKRTIWTSFGLSKLIFCNLCSTDRDFVHDIIPRSSENLFDDVFNLVKSFRMWVRIIFNEFAYLISKLPNFLEFLFPLFDLFKLMKNWAYYLVFVVQNLLILFDFILYLFLFLHQSFKIISDNVILLDKLLDLILNSMKFYVKNFIWVYLFFDSFNYTFICFWNTS